VRVAAIIFAVVGAALLTAAIASASSGALRPRMLFVAATAASLLYQAYGLMWKRPGARMPALFTSLCFTIAGVGLLFILASFEAPDANFAFVVDIPEITAAIVAVVLGFAAAAWLLWKARPAHPNKSLERSRDR
jgi:hypothetical protein